MELVLVLAKCAVIVCVLFPCVRCLLASSDPWAAVNSFISVLRCALCLILSHFYLPLCCGHGVSFCVLFVSENPHPNHRLYPCRRCFQKPRASVLAFHAPYSRRRRCSPPRIGRSKWIALHYQSFSGANQTRQTVARNPLKGSPSSQGCTTGLLWDNWKPVPSIWWFVLSILSSKSGSRSSLVACCSRYLAMSCAFGPRGPFGLTAECLWRHRDSKWRLPTMELFPFCVLALKQFFLQTFSCVASVQAAGADREFKEAR